MGYFTQQIITNEGVQSLARTEAGASSMRFTHIQLGDGSYSLAEKTKLDDAKSLKSCKQVFDVSGVTVKNDTLQIRSTFSNVDLKEDYYIREIGVFAIENDGEEKLITIALCDDNPSLMPAFNTTAIEIPFCDNIAHSGGNGDFSVDYASEAYVNFQDFRELDDRKLNRSEISDWALESKKPSYTKDEVGLGKVDNTSDDSKPVSTAQRDAIDEAYANANEYTVNKISELIDGAPETLDTLKEIADAIEGNQSIVEALNSAIGKKANQTELDTHTGNSTIHITSSERTNWNGAVDKLKAGSAGAELIGAGSGSEPVWRTPSFLSCTTSASTTAKTASWTNFKLVSGAMVTVNFRYTNTASAPTLNINSTGSKEIKRITGYSSGITYDVPEIVAGVHQFIYNGTYWVMIDHGSEIKKINDSLNGIVFGVSSATLSVSANSNEACYIPFPDGFTSSNTKYVFLTPRYDSYSRITAHVRNWSSSNGAFIQVYNESDSQRSITVYALFIKN